ncbi:MAG: cobalt ECF transporter T component CbiQ [Roseburia sp.]|nr:cobalt ECF transporter T component CbiQ [Roseburia sp.]MCM1278197.1 cobalt ECF transporter T component CbiQ [Robinsoniella sp.]
MFKVTAAMLALVFCILADNLYVSLFLIITMGYLIVRLGGLPFSEYLSCMKIPIAFLVMGGVAVALGISEKPAGEYCLSCHWFYLYTSKAALLQAFYLAAKALGAVSAMYMMTLSTPASELISVFRRLHVPRLIVQLMNLIYRFIFIIMEVHCNMKNSAQSRLGYVDLKTSFYSFGSTAGNLLVVSLKKANAYYDAMEARCYQGELLFLEEEKKIEKKQLVAAFLYGAVLIGIYIATG